MSISSDFENLSAKLKSQRDKIELKLHLASMEAKEEWEMTEKKWDHFKDKVEDIADDTKETTKELVDATKVIADELKSAYQRIVKRLSD